MIDLDQIDVTHAKIESIIESECFAGAYTFQSGPFGVFAAQTPKQSQPEPSVPPPQATHVLRSIASSSPPTLEQWAEVTSYVDSGTESGTLMLGEGVTAPTNDPILDTERPPADKVNFPRHASTYLDAQHHPHVPLTEVSCFDTASLCSDMSLQALPRQQQYLLNYYVQKAVSFLCVIDSPESPWRTIHVPKMLGIAGELVVTGTTSLVRNAFFHAILASSAFMLAHETSNTDDQVWAGTAVDLRQQAITFLKSSINKEFYSSAKAKYKEYLLAMLSMVITDVRFLHFICWSFC